MGREVGEDDGDMKGEKGEGKGGRECGSDGHREEKHCFPNLRVNMGACVLNIFLSSTMWSIPLMLTSPAMRMGRDRLTTPLGGPRPPKCGSSSKYGRILNALLHFTGQLMSITMSELIYCMLLLLCLGRLFCASAESSVILSIHVVA